ncbi:hypothetical protein [Mycobacterium sp. 852002-40037_SCH5390672]|uniref:hypothetical protein n=1 Tax=Mycobacterium sp. 852002-40037_SCH5390672 TaxID=1834089 RepID=UPI000804D9E1|nr:hypothetical protein [Mycobacterium sp. 852002-40037_SCH5390672]OBB96431.1 hypothetical protein A5782_04600 [Mycobacterium sp. 852002-40037_SCH5390672]
MSYLGSAKSQVLGALNKVIDLPSRQAKAQTVTVACPVERIEQFWRDPDQLSVVLGDIAEIDADGRDRYRWRMFAEPRVAWESRLVADPGGVRFVGNGNEIVVKYRPAPHELGTEVTLRVKAPAPALLSGAAAFKILHRLRALMQTGEVPTIRSNPSARKSAR